MADRLTKKQRSALMSRIRSRRTTPEMLVHGMLKGRKVRHQMWPNWLHGHPDVWIHPDVIVFVNGCFWHGCSRHWRCPKTNRRFWAEKIRRNAARQRSSVRRLRGLGWSVRTVWECQLRKKAAQKVAALSPRSSAARRRARGTGGHTARRKSRTRL